MQRQILTVMKKSNFFFFLAAMLVACNPDIQFGTSDNMPKIAEHLLGMHTDAGIAYLEKRGFTFEGDELHNQHPWTFILSKGAPDRRFSFEAPVVVWINHDWKDSISDVSVSQRLKTEKSARDLYWKCSHYTATVTMPETIEHWSGVVDIKDLSVAHQKDDWTDYDDREAYWAAFRNESDNIQEAYEYYSDWNLPKEIGLGVYILEDGLFMVEYDTRNYIDVPLPCLRQHRFKEHRSCE